MNTHYPEAYVDYLIHFHGTRDLFECHEILEDYWKSHPDDSLSRVWVGLIQIAVALYHERRKNLRGAEKMMASAIRVLEQRTSDLERLGLNAGICIEQLNQRLADVKTGELQPYTDYNLPLVDNELERLCLEKCKRVHVKWLEKSRLDDPELIHRHKLRDRSDVIAERRRALEARIMRR